MSNFNVISVNPANSAKSALHPEVFERIAREYRIDRDTTSMNISAKKTINSLFGINKGISRKKSIALLASRSLFGAALIGVSLYMGLSFASFSMAWAMLIMGVSLLGGLFSRFTSLLGIGFFGYMSYISTLATGTPDYLTILTTLLSITFFISGPGMFSIDQILRRNMIKGAKKHSRMKAEKLAANRLSYRAMQYM